MAPLRYLAKFEPLFSLDCAPVLHPCAIQGKEGIKFCHLATLVATALIKLCQLKALFLFFPGRFEIQNSPLLLSGASLRGPTLSLFDQAIFNLSLKSLPLSPPSPPRSAADIG